MSEAIKRGAKIGTIDCHLCGWKCAVKEAKSGLAYYSCDGCGSQQYARGPDADQAIRKKMTAVAAPAAKATAAKPAPGTKPADDDSWLDD